MGGQFSSLHLMKEYFVWQFPVCINSSKEMKVRFCVCKNWSRMGDILPVYTRNVTSWLLISGQPIYYFIWGAQAIPISHHRVTSGEIKPFYGCRWLCVRDARAHTHTNTHTGTEGAFAYSWIVKCSRPAHYTRMRARKDTRRNNRRHAAAKPWKARVGMEGRTPATRWNTHPK